MALIHWLHSVHREGELRNGIFFKVPLDPKGKQIESNYTIPSA